MMKPILQRLAAYNVWANHKLLFSIQEMDEAKWYAQTPSSFDTLYKTVLHMWDAESGWLQRMRLHENVMWPSKSFDPSMKDACNGLIGQSMQWESFINESLNEDALASTLIYKNTKGDEFGQPVVEVLHHVFNHSTYHRGQLVTMMRALGETHIPQTDFIAFARKSS